MESTGEIKRKESTTENFRACKFSTEFAFSRYNSEKIEKYVYVSWYFEWDELERVGVKGFVGNITFWLKKQFELTPITETFPVDLIRSGQWIERRINENKNIQTQFSNCTVQFEFCLQPLLTCPDAEPLLCPEMEDTVLKVGENRMKVNRKVGRRGLCSKHKETFSSCPFTLIFSKDSSTRDSRKLMSTR